MWEKESLPVLSDINKLNENWLADEVNIYVEKCIGSVINTLEYNQYKEIIDIWLDPLFFALSYFFIIFSKSSNIESSNIKAINKFLREIWLIEENNNNKIDNLNITSIFEEVELSLEKFNISEYHGYEKIITNITPSYLKSKKARSNSIKAQEESRFKYANIEWEEVNIHTLIEKIQEGLINIVKEWKYKISKFKEEQQKLQEK